MSPCSKQRFTGMTGGDPHISRWGHLKRGDKRYSFHGQCDLVYMHTPDFYHGLGLDLHIRTKVHKFFSYIESTALKIGENILEIQSGGIHKGPHHVWMNGIEVEDRDFPIIKDGFILTTVSTITKKLSERPENFGWHTNKQLILY